MIDRGIFREDERLELLNGLLVVKEPQGDPPAAAVLTFHPTAWRDVQHAAWELLKQGETPRP